MSDDQEDLFGGGGTIKGGYFGDPGAGPDGERCGTCLHCVRVRHHAKTYYKCGLNSMSHSESTDIRLKTAACQHWAKQRPPEGGP